MLGGFSVGVGSRTIGQDEWHLRRAAALIKLLALAPNHRLHREQITENLWPHLDRRAASNNLLRTLHATRRVLDPSESSRYLVSEEGWLALCPAGALWVDVEAFEDAAARREREPAAYRAALELYIGELLPADRYEALVESTVLPPLTSDMLARFVEEGLTTGRPAWVRRVRQWARDRTRRLETGDA